MSWKSKSKLLRRAAKYSEVVLETEPIESVEVVRRLEGGRENGSRGDPGGEWAFWGFVASSSHEGGFEGMFMVLWKGPVSRALI